MTYNPAIERTSNPLDRILVAASAQNSNVEGFIPRRTPGNILSQVFRDLDDIQRELPVAYSFDIRVGVIAVKGESEWKFGIELCNLEDHFMQKKFPNFACSSKSQLVVSVSN